MARSFDGILSRMGTTIDSRKSSESLHISVTAATYLPRPIPPRPQVSRPVLDGKKFERLDSGGQAETGPVQFRNAPPNLKSV